MAPSSLRQFISRESLAREVGQRALASSIADAIVTYLREFERRSGDLPAESR